MGKAVAKIRLAGTQRYIGCLGPWEVRGEDRPGLGMMGVVLQAMVFRQGKAV